MAESKQRNGLDDQEDERIFQSGQASFLLVVIRQIREAATLILDCNPMNALRMAEIIVKDSETLEFYIKNDEKIAKTNEQTASEYSRIIRKKKKKRKLSYYYRLKNERKAKIYKEYYKKNETTVPSHLIPKHRPEETKQEYELRIEHAKEKLKQEIQIAESRRDSYEKKTKVLDNKIDNMIMRKYDKDPIKKEYLRNQWKSECKAEEVKSHQMWQAKEAEMRSKMHRLKKNANPATTRSKRRKHEVTKAETKKMAYTDSEILTDNITMKLKELEHEYIKQFEKKMYAEECGKAFDELMLEKVGQEIDNLETVLENIRKEEEALMIEKEENSDSVNNNNNDSTYYNNICISNGEDSNKAKFKTKIPLPVRKMMKARRRLDLTSNEKDQHFTYYDKQI